MHHSASMCRNKVYAAPVAITGINILVPYLYIKSLQLIWRSGTRRFHLRVPDLQMCCNDLTKGEGTRITTPAMATGKHALLLKTWCHQMETFSALLALCVGNSPATSEFPTQRPATRSFDVFFDLRLVVQTIVRLVIWDAITLIITSLWKA